jgi:quercetin dioxygenase-like cupin family protein
MEWQSGNIFIRENRLAKTGDITNGHKHNFDHTTILMRGSVRITAKLDDGNLIRDAKAPAYVLIKAGVEHEIVALEDDTVYWCVYSHRTPQGEITQDYTGWGDCYV